MMLTDCCYCNFSKQWFHNN